MQGMQECNSLRLPDKFNGQFEAGERLLLGHQGMVQALLAAIFGQPIKVAVLRQTVNRPLRYACRGSGPLEEIVREVDLLAGERVVCRALSHIPLGCFNRADVLEDVNACQMGLGQIVAKYRIPNRRLLLAVGRHESVFWREYVLEGPSLFFRILEAFPRQPFADIGWLESR